MCVKDGRTVSPDNKTLNYIIKKKKCIYSLNELLLNDSKELFFALELFVLLFLYKVLFSEV